MTFNFLPKNKSPGFTLVEVLMVIVLMSILSVVSISLVSSSLDEARFNETTAKLQQVRDAMIGNSEIREARTRTSFGFLGDVGAIPNAAQGITSLIINPALPAYAVLSSVRFGIGWNGPYLSGGAGSDFTKDAWGRIIVYNPAASPPTLLSYGADGIAGGTAFDQDISVSLPPVLTVSSLSGFICKSGGPFLDFVQVELNVPNGSGALTQSEVMVTPGDKGAFAFSAVPFGIRSITVYVPSKAAPTQTLGPVLITVDKPNYLVPCNLIDVSP